MPKFEDFECEFENAPCEVQREVVLKAAFRAINRKTDSGKTDCLAALNAVKDNADVSVVAYWHRHFDAEKWWESCMEGYTTPEYGIVSAVLVASYDAEYRDMKWAEHPAWHALIWCCIAAEGDFCSSEQIEMEMQENDFHSAMRKYKKNRNTKTSEDPDMNSNNDIEHIESIRKQIATLTAALDALEEKEASKPKSQEPPYFRIGYSITMSNISNSSFECQTKLDGYLNIELSEFVLLTKHEGGVDIVVIRNWEAGGWAKDMIWEALLNTGAIETNTYWGRDVIVSFDLILPTHDSCGRAVEF